MQVTIDIDMDKIDYSDINKQIKDKLQDLTPDQIFERYYKTEDDIRRYIEEKLDEGSNEYIVEFGWSGRDEPKKNISDLAVQMITEKLEPVIEELFDKFPQEDFDKLFQDVTPTIMCDILYKRLSDNLACCEYSGRKQVEGIASCMVDQGFAKRGIVR